MTKATWRKGKRRITGSWTYNWSADKFHIYLNSVDDITGEKRTITVHGDTPEFYGWKLVQKRVKSVENIVARCFSCGTDLKRGQRHWTLGDLTSCDKCRDALQRIYDATKKTRRKTR